MIASYGPYWIKRPSGAVADFIGQSNLYTGIPTVYFAEDTNPGYVLTAGPIAKKSQFLSAITSPASVTFESFDELSYSSLVANFPAPQAGVSVTFTAPDVLEDTPGLSIDSTIDFGRFNTTSGGTKFLQMYNEATLTFSTPISAFGLYGTDWGDFNGKMRVTFTDTTATEITFDIPHALGSQNGSLIFWGFVDPIKQYTSVKFFASYEPGDEPAPGDGDYFGLDDIVVGTPVTSAYNVSPPTGPAPLSVQFTDLTPGSTAWEWDITNNGSVDYTTQNPLVVYSSPGTYDVKLSVTTPSGVTTIVKTGYVVVT